MTGYALEPSTVAPGCRSRGNIRVRERHYAPWVGEKAPFEQAGRSVWLNSNTEQDQGEI